MILMIHPQFVLDTNVFVSAKNDYYAFDICPSFWDKLIDAFQNGDIVSIDRVYDEILQRNDELTDWARNEASAMFVPSTDQAVATAYSQMLNWVQQNDFTPAAKAEFLDAADGWLAAYASVHNATVVTLETFDANIKRRVKLPNVCRQFDVEFINTFEMLRRLGIRF